MALNRFAEFSLPIFLKQHCTLFLASLVLLQAEMSRHEMDIAFCNGIIFSILGIFA